MNGYRVGLSKSRGRASTSRVNTNLPPTTSISNVAVPTNIKSETEVPIDDELNSLPPHIQKFIADLREGKTKVEEEAKGKEKRFLEKILDLEQKNKNLNEELEYLQKKKMKLDQVDDVSQASTTISQSKSVLSGTSIQSRFGAVSTSSQVPGTSSSSSQLDPDTAASGLAATPSSSCTSTKDDEDAHYVPDKIVDTPEVAELIRKIKQKRIFTGGQYRTVWICPANGCDKGTHHRDLHRCENHVRVSHGGENQKKATGHCSRCLVKVQGDYTFKDHLLICQNPKLHVCPSCDEAFKTAANLAVHIKKVQHYNVDDLDESRCFAYSFDLKRIVNVKFQPQNKREIFRLYVTWFLPLADGTIPPIPFICGLSKQKDLKTTIESDLRKITDGSYVLGVDESGNQVVSFVTGVFANGCIIRYITKKGHGVNKENILSPDVYLLGPKVCTQAKAYLRIRLGAQAALKPIEGYNLVKESPELLDALETFILENELDQVYADHVRKFELQSDKVKSSYAEVLPTQADSNNNENDTL